MIKFLKLYISSSLKDNKFYNFTSIGSNKYIYFSKYLNESRVFEIYYANFCNNKKKFLYRIEELSYKYIVFSFVNKNIKNYYKSDKIFSRDRLHKGFYHNIEKYFIEVS